MSPKITVSFETSIRLPATGLPTLSLIAIVVSEVVKKILSTPLLINTDVRPFPDKLGSESNGA